MKRYIIILSIVCLCFSSCAIFKKDKTSNKVETTTNNKPQDKNKTVKPDYEKQRKDALKEQKRLTKEAQKKKAEEEKLAKQKQKEQDKIIADAQKAEKNKIKEERKKEKEALRQKEKEASSNDKESSLKKAADFVLKGGDNNEESDKNASEDVMKEIMYGKDSTSKDTTVTVLSKQEKKNIIEQSKKADKKQEGNFFKRTFRKAFPKKVERDLTYSNIYKEKPKTIMIMYPWNRSKDENADEMLYVSATKELCGKGYYVLPATTTIMEYKQDTSFNSHYVKINDIKEYKSKYGVDAVLFVTIYRFEKPWWSTNVNVVADYNLISTQTLDTLFSRKADFNYDTPIPPKEKVDKTLVNDENQVHKLGVMEQMQRYVFLDLPIGPYNEKYLSDQKKFSHKKEMKYKVDVRPS
jgi:hypothetical protein